MVIAVVFLTKADAAESVCGHQWLFRHSGYLASGSVQLEQPQRDWGCVLTGDQHRVDSQIAGWSVDGAYTATDSPAHAAGRLFINDVGERAVRLDDSVHGLWLGVFILCYNFTVLMAYRWVAANEVTSAEYTGLLWALLGGWVFFDEAPDLWFIIGSSMIVVPLILIGLKERKRAKLPVRQGSVTP